MPGGTTAHTLAPSKEALDTPLSTPPLDDEPGSATGLSSDYPHGTPTRRSGPAFRTQHQRRLRRCVRRRRSLVALRAGNSGSTPLTAHGRERRTDTGADHQRPEKRQRCTLGTSAISAGAAVATVSAAAIAAASESVGSGVICSLRMAFTSSRSQRQVACSQRHVAVLAVG